MTAVLAQKRATSSTKIAKDRWSSPAPPSASGPGMPSSPSLAALSTRSRGNSLLWSIASARGLTSRSAKSRASLRISSCSGLRDRSTSYASNARMALRAARVGRRAGVHADDGGLALRHPRADAGGAVTAAPPAQRIDQGHQDAGAGGTDGMADSERTTIDIDPLLIDSEQVHGGTRHRGK